MGSHHHIEINKDERFEFSAAGKKRILMGLLIGVVLTVIGLILVATGIDKVEHHAAGHGTEAHATVAAAGMETNADAHGAEAHSGEAHKADLGVTNPDVHAKAHDMVDAKAAEGHHEFHWTTRLWANLWHNGIFFTGLALIGIFFVAVQYVAYAGWSSGLKRVPMAFGSFLPVGGIVLLVVFLIANHDLFHWTHHELYDETSPKYDKIIAGKAWYLNVPFYLVRMVLFFGLWYLYWTLIRKQSLAEDLEGGTARWKKAVWFSSGFLVIFAVSSSMAAWDWLMSVDAHWFSTLFGWYTFASWHVSGIAVITLTVIFLKEKGYLKHINQNHLHDLGKFMFAFSVFWTYLWVAQFLLYYYANIPEEVIYYIERRDGFGGHYTFLFFFNLAINFAFPFLFLMTRDAKRQVLYLKIAAFAILGGHWLDFYLMIMPGVTKGNSNLGLLEFGLLIVFACTFIYIVSNTLSKHPLIAKNHPMLEESLHHDI